MRRFTARILIVISSSRGGRSDEKSYPPRGEFERNSPFMLSISLRSLLEQDMTIQSSLRTLLLLGALTLFPTAPASAQTPSESTDGINSGNYNIRQTIEFGYRFRDLNGNEANYNTFVDLGSGPRLLNFTLDMHSLDHNGLFFDNLALTNFGYGGDPNNISRLRFSKNKWYDFSGTFRRNKYPWNYNLLANPLNPVSSNPALAISSSPHALNLVRRMSDFDLRLMPQSRVRLRLGYTRNIEEGPSLSTFGGITLLDPPTGHGSQTQVFQEWKTTLNAYHLGVDFLVLPKTSFHYDQFLQSFKQDTSYVDRNFGYQLSNGIPVDLGIVLDTVNGVPCSSPVVNPGTTPPTADPSCNGHLSYSRVGRPRNFLPTEQFSFESDYFKKVSMSGRASYSSGEQNSHDLNESFTGNNASVLQVGGTSMGPSHAKRVSANADWAATWSITPNFRIVDSFSYDHFQIPGAWDFSTLSSFAQAPLINGGPSLLLPPGRFNPTDCPPPFSAPTCPQHNSDSGPDANSGAWTRFLAQKHISNTLQVAYDFTSRFGARLGYRYDTRKVFSQDTLFLANEVFFPGGPGGTAANFFNAARGDCAAPTACTQQPDGSLVFTGSVGDTSHVQDVDIHAHSMLMGLWARPTDTLRLSFDLDLFWADASFVRIDPRQQQHYRFHAAYTPATWVSLDASFDILEHRNNIQLVNLLEHNHSYGFTAVFNPNNRFSLDFGYNYNVVFSQSIACFSYGAAGSPPPPPGAITTPCPVPLSLQGSDIDVFGALSFYKSTTHFAYGDLRWKPVKRVTATVGYAGTFANGNTLFLNPNAPFGPLQYAYQKPYAGIAIDLVKGLTYKTSWSYYGYNPRSLANPPGLAPIGTQDFNGNLVTVALRYSF